MARWRRLASPQAVRGPRGRSSIRVEPGLGEAIGDRRQRPPGGVEEVVLGVVEAHPPRLHAGHVEQVVDDDPEAPDAVVHGTHRLLLGLGEGAELLVLEELHVADDGGHRRGQLVGDVPVELGPGGVQLAQPGVGPAELGHLLFEVGDDALALLHEPGRPRRVQGRGRLPRTLEVTLEARGERARVDWLLEEAVAPDRQAGLAIALGGDGHDGHPRQRSLAAQPQGDLEAVEPGDVQVDQHQIRPLRRTPGGPLRARRQRRSPRARRPGGACGPAAGWLDRPRCEECAAFPWADQGRSHAPRRLVR